MRKQLTITQELVSEVMPSCAGDGAEAFSVLEDLKEVSQKLDKKLQRYLQQSGEKACWLNIQKNL